MALAETGRVLVLEPNPSILDSYTRQLSKAGFEVTKVSEATDALERAEHTHFDLFISDFQLPKTDGLQLFRLLRDKGGDLQFVLLLEGPNNERALEAAELGAFQSLIKPVRPDVLRRTAVLAMRLKRERTRLPIASARRFPTRSSSISATEAKNEFGKLLEKTIQGDVVVITKHDTPKAVLLSFEGFEALSDSPQSRINTLSAEFDSLLLRMQDPFARSAMQAAFSASPKQLGAAALKAARKHV